MGTAEDIIKGDILIVDDNPVNLKLLSRLLAEKGYKVRLARSGELALTATQIAQPDLILLDINMPEMNGYEVCEHLKVLPQTRNIPIIFISALDEISSKMKAFTAGGVDYITKPFQFEEVLARVETHLSLQRLQKELIKANEALEDQISEQKRLTALILQAKNEWEVTFDSVNDMILITDSNNNLIRCNDAGVILLLKSGIAFSNTSLGDLFFNDSKKTIAFENQKEIEIPVLGGIFEINLYPIIFENEVRGKIYILKDITEKKKIEANLLVSQKLAGIGTLAAGMAHEINSPLQVITAISDNILEILQNGDIEKDRLLRYIETISRSSWRVSDIVRSLITYAQSSGEPSESLVLNEIVCNTLLLIKKQTEEKTHIFFSTNLDPNLTSINGDRNRLTQAILNIINNACDAMPNGGKITIRTWDDPIHDLCCLEIKDTGSGIPEEFHSKIFDPFFTTKPIGKGMGLGLSVVLGIVKAHSGKITVDSSPDKGTSFTIFLPHQQDINAMKSSNKEKKLARYDDSI